MTSELQYCECIGLTGETRHDCPKCGGEGFVTKEDRRVVQLVDPSGFVGSCDVYPGDVPINGELRVARIKLEGDTIAVAEVVTTVQLKLRRTVKDEVTGQDRVAWTIDAGEKFELVKREATLPVRGDVPDQAARLILALEESIPSIEDVPKESDLPAKAIDALNELSIVEQSDEGLR